MLYIVNKSGEHIFFDNLTENEIFELKLAQRSEYIFLLSSQSKPFLEDVDFAGYQLLSLLRIKLLINMILISSSDNHYYH